MVNWEGETPFFLRITAEDGASSVDIDLDRRGWASEYAEWMRASGLWSLVHKERGHSPIVLWVHPGEQPYYTARHVGVTSSAGGNEIKAYGLGKKLINGEMVRLWLLPNGVVCGGDDIDTLGVLMVKAIGPK